MSGDEMEALFCIALLNTLKVEDTSRVLTKYRELKDNPETIAWIREQRAGSPTPGREP
jgi:hypothetical protein